MFSNVFRYGFVIAIFTAIPAFVSCLKCLSCQCGSSNRNNTYCNENGSEEDFSCEKWAQCQTCEDNSTYCITCPDNRSGNFCTEDTVTMCADPGYMENGGQISYYHNVNSSLLSISFSGMEYPVDTQLAYDCSEGFHLEGEKLLNCLSNGSWSGEKPRCIEDTVEIPPLIRQNTVRITQSTRQSTVGITKLIRRKRFSPFASCVKPRSLRNGRIQMHLPLTASDRYFYEYILPVGTRLQYSCNNGYVLHGKTDQTCENTGYWSGEKPTCIEVKEKTTCPDPGVPQGTSRESVDGTDERTPRIFEVGEALYFYCDDEDYVLEGALVINCTSFGNWTDSTPSCQIEEQMSLKSETCLDPGIPEGGRRQNVNGIEVSEERRFEEGQSLYFFCNDEDSELVGDSHITCTSTGWSDPTPRCEKKEKGKCNDLIYCKNTSPIENGRVQVCLILNEYLKCLADSKFPLGTVLHYSCDEGFVIQGVSKQICQSNGTWSEEKPSCIEDLARCPDLGLPAGETRQDASGTVEDDEQVFKEGNRNVKQ